MADKPMSIHEMQETVDQWIRQFEEGYFDPMTMVVRLSEELGELAREVTHVHGPKKKKGSEAPGSIEEELGDMLFVLTCLANSLGIDIEGAFVAVMAKYDRRDRGRWTPRLASAPDPADQDGAGQEVDEGQ